MRPRLLLIFPVVSLLAGCAAVREASAFQDTRTQAITGASRALSAFSQAYDHVDYSTAAAMFSAKGRLSMERKAAVEGYGSIAAELADPSTRGRFNLSRARVSLEGRDISITGPFSVLKVSGTQSRTKFSWVDLRFEALLRSSEGDWKIVSMRIFTPAPSSMEQPDIQFPEPIPATTS